MTKYPMMHVQALADYNSEKATGEWIETDHGAEAIQEEIDEILKNSKEPNAEAFIVTEYDNMPDFGEHPDIELLAEVMEIVEDHGSPFLAWLDNCMDRDMDDADEMRSEFEERYRGEYSDAGEYGEEMAEGMFSDYPKDSKIWMYIDYKSIAHDFDLSGGVFVQVGQYEPRFYGIYVFDYTY